MRVPGGIGGTDNLYTASRAALLTAHQQDLRGAPPIETIVFTAMGTGFVNVSFDEAARQMRAAWQFYVNPPHRLDRNWVVQRHKTINQTTTAAS